MCPSGEEPISNIQKEEAKPGRLLDDLSITFKWTLQLKASYGCEGQHQLCVTAFWLAAVHRGV